MATDGGLSKSTRGRSLMIPCEDYPPKTNMATENPPFEDVFPIENGHFLLPC